MLRPFCALVAIFLHFTCGATHWPKENSTLNYRLVGFSPPGDKMADYYLLEVAEGINNNDVYFKKNRILTDTSVSPKIVALLPAFGKSYTWRITYLNNKYKTKDKTPLYHFSTGTLLYADTGKYRLHIIQKDTTHKDLFVLLDATRTMYEASGAQPVWYLPSIPGIVDNQTAIRDLKPTLHGTITFLAGDKICETDYEGNILWRGPDNGKISNDSSEFYHHEFTRLQNGNYMAAGTEHIAWPDDDSASLDSVQHKRRRGFDNKALCGTLIEYDSLGNIVWFWKSSTYFSYADLFARMPGTNVTAKTHLNGFYFDEKNKFIYVSFRDVNRIVKIYYPEKRVVAAYGAKYAGNDDRVGNSYFYGQHNCRISAGGDLYLFNNNAILQKGEDKRPNNKSSLLVLKEPSKSGDTLSKKWEFSCIIDDYASAKSLGGGSICELADGSFLSSMGTVNRVFIVSKDKKLLWNVLVEMNAGITWEPFASYRASAIENRQNLEKLIFNHK